MANNTMAQEDPQAAGGFFRELLTDVIAPWMDYRTANAIAEAERLHAQNLNTEVRTGPMAEGTYDLQRLAQQAQQNVGLIIGGIAAVVIGGIILKKMVR